MRNEKRANFGLFVGGLVQPENLMSEPWKGRELTDREREAFSEVLDRGGRVTVETNAGNTKIKVIKPRPTKKR